MLIDNLFYKRNKQLNVEDKYNLKRKAKEQELDDILEKIHKRGMNSLTKKERMMLKEFSKQSQ